MLGSQPSCVRVRTENLRTEKGEDHTPEQAAVQSFRPHLQGSDALADEVRWARKVCAKSDNKIIDAMVLHRGFHASDDSTRRPIENSLNSYEIAWSSGFCYCECDVIATKDDFVVLNHDVNLQRLALFQKSLIKAKASLKRSTTQVVNLPLEELTWREIVNMPLKSGARPPLLTEVLQSASYIADDARLVIELKYGDENDSVTPFTKSPSYKTIVALTKVLKANPSLIRHVGVVMSFDLRAISTFAELWAKEIAPSVEEYNLELQGTAWTWVTEFNPCWSRTSSSVKNEKNLPPLQRPKLMLLTVGKHEDSSWLYKYFGFDEDNFDDPAFLRQQFLKVEDSIIDLDGIYMEWHEDLTSKNAEKLRGITKKGSPEDGITVGVWQYANTVDDYEEAGKLVDLGVSFVNSDMPRSFVQY